MIGSYGHFDIDAQTFADWGVDMVKADYCHKPGNESGIDLYTQFSKALNATGANTALVLDFSVVDVVNHLQDN